MNRSGEHKFDLTDEWDVDTEVVNSRAFKARNDMHAAASSLVGVRERISHQ